MAWAQAGAEGHLIAERLGRSRKAVYLRIWQLRKNGRAAPPLRAYQPAKGWTVPCAACGMLFHRDRITQKFCSPPCKRLLR